MGELKGKVSWFEEELNEEKKANIMAVNKLNDNLDVIWKIENYILEPAHILNKAKLFDEGLAKNPVSTANVILVLVNFN